jgi:hypothetical protein
MTSSFAPLHLARKIAYIAADSAVNPPSTAAITVL